MFYHNILTSWFNDVMKISVWRYMAKISKIIKKSLIKHEINRKFVCFTCKIKLYYIRKHQLLYFHSRLCHSWKYCICCSLCEIYFDLTLKQTNILCLISTSSVYLNCLIKSALHNEPIVNICKPFDREFTDI